jgi:signal transduction histidine kinase
MKLQMTLADDCLEIIIADNGRGFDWNTIRRGNGPKNLCELLKALKDDLRRIASGANGRKQAGYPRNSLELNC